MSNLLELFAKYRQYRIDKAAARFGNLSNIWNSKAVSFNIEVKLYETPVLSVQCRTVAQHSG